MITTIDSMIDSAVLLDDSLMTLVFDENNEAAQAKTGLQRHDGFLRDLYHR